MNELLFQVNLKVCIRTVDAGHVNDWVAWSKNVSRSKIYVVPANTGNFIWFYSSEYFQKWWSPIRWIHCDFTIICGISINDGLHHSELRSWYSHYGGIIIRWYISGIDLHCIPLCVLYNHSIDSHILYAFVYRFSSNISLPMNCVISSPYYVTLNAFIKSMRKKTRKIIHSALNMLITVKWLFEAYR